MQHILSIITPIFLLIFLGYLSVYFRLIPQSAIAGLGRFVLYLSLPALIIKNLVGMNLDGLLNPLFLGIYGAGGLLTIGITLVGSRLLFQDKWYVAGIRGIGATMPNSIYIGFPLVLQTVQNESTQAFIMAILVENVLLFPFLLIFIEVVLAKKETDLIASCKAVLMRVLGNPIILSILVGLLWKIFNLPLPEVIHKSLGILGQAATPVALIVIGGTLVGTSINSGFNQMIMVAGLKLVAFPLIVSSLLILLPGLSSDLKTALIIFSALPMFSIYPIIGGAYGEAQFCASTLLLTTLLSAITISVMLLIVI